MRVHKDKKSQKMVQMNKGGFKRGSIGTDYKEGC